ncbi:SGNH/GDSL hydrolase family protein [Alicyclobacillus tolerans]|uniref:SGNH/GDSL hydrolase family protein n=1 Tax=Alicyclobacillus tolerans TaxID=90970 RepID=UPI001F44ACD5|nr:SGNH/GDSL hydrolase family protein [Alicyclobacillus tolerans]MCF8565968.1 SGNH/GDSL hydrolase family protein [Alicyclobacillus tolerans]
MLYAALGDSITYGYSAEDENARYVNRIQSSLSRKQPVNLFLHAKPGWTSKQLLKESRKVPDVIWAEARLITIMVGGNDVLRHAPWLLDGGTTRIFKVADKLRDNLEELIDLVRGPKCTIVLGTLYNPFPKSVMVERYLDVINQSIRSVAQREKLPLADIAKHFVRREGQFIDGYKRGKMTDMRIIGNPIHPNDKGHEAIAQIFLRAYQRSTGGTRSSNVRVAKLRSGR